MTQSRKGCLVIAHRGASAECRQNTLSAFELAVAEGVDMIETDLHLTADRRIVLIHDSWLPGVGQIASLSFSQIREFDLGGGERVPSFEEALDHFSARVSLNLELKSRVAGCYPGLEAQALRAVEARGQLGQTLFSSFEHETLMALGELEPRARLGLLANRPSEELVSDVLCLGVESLHSSSRITTTGLLEESHRAGLAVYVFTVNLSGELKFWISCGVDGVFTNCPRRLVEILEARELRDLPSGKPRYDSS